MILCCGEALIDMIPVSDAAGPEAFVPHNGGAVFNTSIALGRLGVASGLLTGLSGDMFGRQLEEGLRASHVDTSHVITSDRPSTLAFVKLADGQACYSFFDENSAGRMLTPADMPMLSPDVTALFFGGISLATEPCAEAYASLLMRESKTHAVMIDPNIRPGFVADEGRYRDRLERMFSCCDIVKLSDEDLCWLDPSARGLDEKVAGILAGGSLGGPSVVILTRGPEGATGYPRSGGEVSVPALPVEIADTVGAGDTFNAGVMARLAERGALQKSALAALGHDVLADAMGYGAKVAAITVSRAGANPPWAHEL